MIKQNLTESLISLRSNLLRSFLTMSGIVIGIAAVVAVLSIGKGHEEKIEAQIQQMGANVFWVGMIRSPVMGNFSMPPILPSRHTLMNAQKSHNKIGLFTPKFLTNADANAIKKRCTAVKWSAPVISSFANGRINGKSVQINITATTPEYRKVRSISVVSGRYLADEDLHMLNDVCVIEENPYSKFLTEQEYFIFINSRRFKIIGVIKRESSQFIPDNTIAIHIPLSVAHKKILGSQAVQSIYCLSKDHFLDEAKQQVEITLQSRRGGVVNYDIRGIRDLFSKTETLTKTTTMVTAGIGMISLFVGGIGIMNILLASVFERIKEIGIRRSVGARKIDILIQLLFEAITLTMLGGIIGVISGIIITRFLSTAIEIPSVLSFEAAIAGLVTSSITGVIFGIYPALKAANLDPVESLRYE